MIDISDLKSFGFVSTRYKGQAGTFFKKTMKVADLPPTSERVSILETSAVVEVTPNGEVALIIGNTGWFEGPFDTTSIEGQALLLDASKAKFPRSVEALECEVEVLRALCKKNKIRMPERPNYTKLSQPLNNE